MPGINSSGSSVALTNASKQTASNTHNLEEVLELLRNEMRRLRIDLVDAAPGDEDVL